MDDKYKNLAYTELKYKQPKVTIEEAVESAWMVLEEAYRIDPGLLFYLLQHSNLILLAKLRTQSPYNCLSSNMTSERIGKFLKLLEEHDFFIMSEEDGFQNFSICRKTGFSELLQGYEFLKECTDLPQLTEYTSEKFVVWSSSMEVILARQMEENMLPKEWLADRWAPHNLRFGMLLGYPGKAISSSLWSAALHIKFQHEEPMVDVSIEGHEDLLGAQLGFDTAVSTETDQEITDIVKLWDKTIETIMLRVKENHYDKNEAFSKEREQYRLENV